MFKKVVSISVKTTNDTSAAPLSPTYYTLTVHLLRQHRLLSSPNRLLRVHTASNSGHHLLKKQLAVAALPACPLYTRSNKKSQLILSWTAGFSQKYKSYSAAEAEETCASRINDLISDFGFLATGS
jgi:hypothetical protein